VAVTDEAAVKAMTERIVETVHPRMVVLFGSRAKGSARSDSDADFLVVEDQSFGPQRSRYRETARIIRALAGFGIAKDVLVYSLDEVERWKNARNHVIAHALREGRILYDRRT
jgi:predicted nucleotidyltransferase